MYYLYCVSGKKEYYGVTNNPGRMFREIKCWLRVRDVTKLPVDMIVDWWDKGGADNFNFEIVGEFESKEEAKIMMWYCMVEENREGKVNEVVVMVKDAPADWVYRKNELYNVKGVKLAGLSEQGKLLVAELTGLSLSSTGTAIMGRKEPVSERNRSGHRMKGHWIYKKFGRMSR